jgi:hypothetical protein
MRVDLSEVEFSDNQEEHGAHGGKAHEAAGVAFGRLELAVNGFDIAIGLLRLCPCNDAVKVIANYFRTSFIGSTLERITLSVLCRI